jgi:glucuronate isomerase
VADDGGGGAPPGTAWVGGRAGSPGTRKMGSSHRTMDQPTMALVTDDFLLTTDAARTLYHDYAADMPIYDYHCHLPPADLAGDRRFDNLFEAWLEGDHYKWRLMRANGVGEEYCTGDAEPYDKFLAFARTVPQTLRNPMYHWTHLELQRYFGIDVMLNEQTAGEVWAEANRQLKAMPVSDILAKFRVALIGTTDDPADSLEHHHKLAEELILPDTAVYPAFRPDKCLQIADPAQFNGYVDKLLAAAGENGDSFYDFKQAIARRHGFFHAMGSRLSDHGLTHLPAAVCTDSQAKAIYDDVRAGRAPTAEQVDRFTMYTMLEFGELNHDAGWCQQLHLGAMRNNNAWAWEHLGPDTGFDSIGDYRQGPGLRALLGELAGRRKLARTVLYNLNPVDNYLFASMIGNYQDGVTPGKMQFGSGWWFNDQKQGMSAQIDALSNNGLLARFVGMLTDSRSFLSYPRHEYFRRTLCDLLGRDIEAGELPDDTAMLGAVVQDICFHNARDYFGMQLKGAHA